MKPDDTEHTAWLWLLALPRVDIPPKTSGWKIRELVDRQVKIELCPGALHANQGAPGVKVSFLVPGLKKRVSGMGNNLYSACEQAHNAAWREGVKLPFLIIFDIDRKRDPSLKIPRPPDV